MTDKEKIKQLEDEIWALRDSCEEQKNMMSDVIADWQQKYYEIEDKLRKYETKENE